MKKVLLKIFEIVGSEYCVAADDGQKVYDQLIIALKKDLGFRISFQNVKRLTSAFLNVAIGQLYGEFSEDFIRSHLSVAHIERDDLALLVRVIDTAKQYFIDRDSFDATRKEILEEDDDAGI